MSTLLKLAALALNKWLLSGPRVSVWNDRQEDGASH
jgi:hypothetical protein